VPSGFSTGFGNVSKATEGGLTQPLSTTTTAALTKLDIRARHKSFEFQTVYRIIHDLGPSVVRRAYHNYSALGIFTLGKYNLDLAIVTHEGKLMLFNADSWFTHSCETCPLPPGSKRTFVGGQTHDQLRAKSNQRDAAIREWARQINAQSLASGGPADAVVYHVVHDCHSQGFSRGNLKATFASTPGLSALVKGYRLTDRLAHQLTLADFQKLVHSEDDADQDNSFTYIVKADVSIVPPQDWISSSTDPEMEAEDLGERGEDSQDKESHWTDDGSYSLGPLVIYHRIERQTKLPTSVQSAVDAALDHEHQGNCCGRSFRTRLNAHTKQTLAWSGRVVLTRDYSRWLRRTFGDRLSIDGLEWALFYKTEPAINGIYRQLVELRSTTSDPIMVTFIKRLVNLSCGFYGARASQINQTTYRLVDRAPRNYAFFRHKMYLESSVDLGNQSYFLLETIPWPKIVPGRPPARSAIAIFLAVVEYGKLRLVQIFHFLRQHLVPGSYRLLYSNIDNLVMALGGEADCFDQAVEPSRRQNYLDLKSRFLLDSSGPDNGGGHANSSSNQATKIPGMAELKWTRYGPECLWRFITVRIQHYCISVPAQPDLNLHKCSGWSDISSEEAIRFAEDLLKGRQVQVFQNRRVRKMANTKTQVRMFHYQL
jgi:hypothetical protein